MTLFKNKLNLETKNRKKEKKNQNYHCPIFFYLSEFTSSKVQKGEFNKVKEDLTIFMHIPKTGGTTLNSIFRNQYDKNQFYDHLFPIDDMRKKYNELDQEAKNNIKAVSGHYSYGINKIFSKSFTYFTMLRNPVERVISLYYFLKSTPTIYPEMKDMTFTEFIDWSREAKNGQTKQVSGLWGNPSVEKAKENLRTFRVIGLTERFDESLFLMKKAFGWSDIEYNSLNITKKRPLKSELSQKVISLIEEHNQLDFELYRYAQELFEKQINSLNKESKQELVNYLKKNDL